MNRCNQIFLIVLSVYATRYQNDIASASTFIVKTLNNISYSLSSPFNPNVHALYAARVLFPQNEPNSYAEAEETKKTRTEQNP